MFTFFFKKNKSVVAGSPITNDGLLRKQTPCGTTAKFNLVSVLNMKQKYTKSFYTHPLKRFLLEFQRCKFSFMNRVGLHFH